LGTRLRVALELLFGLRPADLQTARISADAQFAGHSLVVRWAKLVGWAWRQMWVTIPDADRDLVIEGRISRTPMWLIDANPLANHPWESDPSARLPEEVDTVVIGAGFTGAAVAYHWARRAPDDRRLLVLARESVSQWVALVDRVTPAELGVETSVPVPINRCLRSQDASTPTPATGAGRGAVRHHQAQPARC